MAACGQTSGSNAVSDPGADGRSNPRADRGRADTPTPEPPDDRPLVDVSHLLDFVREGIYKNSDGVGGAAWLDYDRDGFLDLYITNTRDAKNALFRNNGDGTFTNVADQAGVTSETGNTAVVAGDIDNDGCTDLLMSGDGGFIGDELKQLQGLSERLRRRLHGYHRTKRPRCTVRIVLLGHCPR